MEEPLVPEPPPPGGGVQQRGHVVRGEGGAKGDGDTRAHLTRVTWLGRWLHYKQSHLECAAGDDVPGVADAGVVEEAGHGVDAATLVRAVLSCHGHTRHWLPGTLTGSPDWCLVTSHCDGVDIQPAQPPDHLLLPRQLQVPHQDADHLPV